LASVHLDNGIRHLIEWLARDLPRIRIFPILSSEEKIVGLPEPKREA
jgi:hypothetical protein